MCSGIHSRRQREGSGLNPWERVSVKTLSKCLKQGPDMMLSLHLLQQRRAILRLHGPSASILSRWPALTPTESLEQPIIFHRGVIYFAEIGSLTVAMEAQRPVALSPVSPLKGTLLVSCCWAGAHLSPESGKKLRGLCPDPLMPQNQASCGNDQVSCATVR